MPERIMPGLGLRAFYDPGQRAWGTSVSEDLRQLSVLVQARAVSRSTTLPANGNAGDVFIVPTGAPVDADAIALWDGVDGVPAWVFLTPQPGWQVWVTDEARGVRYSGTEWIALPRPGIVPIRILGGAAHTLQLIDTGCILEATGASPATLTIPNGATVPFAIGALINVTQVGAGVTTLTAAPDVSLNGVIGGAVAIAAQWGGVALTKRGADAWVIQGALAGAVT